MILQFMTGLKCQVLQDDGTPGIGWKLYTWQGGTFDVALETFVDSNGDSENTNPVIFDARGEASIALLPRAYNFELKDENDVLIETVENFTLAPQATFDGGYLVDTVADMRALAPGLARYVVTLGYNSKDDGCGQTYDYDSASTAGDDGVLVFSPDSAPATGRYKLRYSGPVSIRYAGDPGNLTSSVTSITACISAIAASDAQKADLLFPAGFYVNDAASINFGAGINVIAEYGADLITSGTGSFTFSGGFTSPVQKVFGEDANITFSCPIDYAVGEWFGIVGDNSTDNLSAFEKLIEATQSWPIPWFLAGNQPYSVSAPLSLPSIPYIYAGALVTDGSVTYIKKGITLDPFNSSVSGYQGSFYLLNVVTDAVIGGSISIGGTFSANSLASLVGDITSARDMIAGRDASIYRNITAGNIIEGLTLHATNTVLADSEIISNGRITAGYTGQGFLLNRAGNANHWGDAQVRIGQEFGAVGNAGISGSSTLHSFLIPANTLVDDESSLIFRAAGTFASNTNDKTVRLNFGATLLNSGTLSNTSVDGVTQWSILVRATKFGTNSLIVESILTLNPNPSASIRANIMSSSAAVSVNLTTNQTLSVTGQSGSSAANDIVGLSLTADYQPRVANFV